MYVECLLYHVYNECERFYVRSETEIDPARETQFLRTALSEEFSLLQ